jgi:hypothetical protein
VRVSSWRIVAVKLRVAPIRQKVRRYSPAGGRLRLRAARHRGAGKSSAALGLWLDQPERAGQ